MEEIYKPIKGFEEQYLISNKGNVLSLGNSFSRKDKLLKGGKTKQGYCIVSLYGKSFYRHRLVALAFVKNPHNYTEVHHIDNNKQNNIAENLIWLEHKQIINNCFKSSFINREYCSKPVNILSKKGVLLRQYPSIKQASIETNISVKNISKACNGKTKTAGSFNWLFA